MSNETYSEPVGEKAPKLTKQDIFALAKQIQEEAVESGREKPFFSEAAYEAKRRLSRKHGEEAVMNCFVNTGDAPLTFREKE